MPRLSLLGAALALVASGSNVHAQEVVKIDTESGRTIIDDEWRSMYRGLAAVDWDRKLLYVGDREEPDGIMVFSLETGEHVRTISTPRGDGPQELRDGRQGIALKPDGGAYISGYLRVLEFDPAGNYLASWSPVRPPSQRVCDFGGAPAVAIQDGVVRRGPNGEDQMLGSVGESGESIRATTVAEGIRISTMLLAETHIVCTDDDAYVVAAQEEGPATVTIYRLDGSTDSLEVPVEGAASRPCTIGGQPCPPLVTAATGLARRPWQPRHPRRRFAHAREHHRPRDRLLRTHPRGRQHALCPGRHPCRQRPGVLRSRHRDPGQQHGKDPPEHSAQLVAEDRHAPAPAAQRRAMRGHPAERSAGALTPVQVLSDAASPRLIVAVAPSRSSGPATSMRGACAGNCTFSTREVSIRQIPNGGEPPPMLLALWERDNSFAPETVLAATVQNHPHREAVP